MNIKITDTCVILEEGAKSLTLFEKPLLPDYQNVTKRPYISYYFEKGETVWSYLQTDMGLLADLCADDPYLGCYALLFRRLHPLLLTSSQAKNVIAYGPPTDCAAYRVFQDFITFLQEGNALTALAQSPFAFTILGSHCAHACLYCLDHCPFPTVVCDAICKIKPGGLLLLYTTKETLPAKMDALCAHAVKDSFGSCTLYTLTIDTALMALAQENGTQAFLLSQSAEITKRVNDLQNLVQAIRNGASLSGDTRLIAAAILQQTEEFLLSLYDYLEDDELPVRTNALKEILLNYHAAADHQYDLTTYRQKLARVSDDFFTAMEREFS